MMEQCVMVVDSNQYLVFVGNVPNVPIMICAHCVTMVISILLDTDFTGFQILAVKGIESTVL